MHREVVMKKWLRRIRGAIGMGLTWAIAWFVAGLGLLLVVGQVGDGGGPATGVPDVQRGRQSGGPFR